MTILHLSDWGKYPQSVPHHSTANDGFLQLAGKYRKMGVENYQMILAIHNPQLIDINPYDPNLSIEQQSMVMLECYDNFWYFLREATRVPGVAGRDPIQFRPNRAVIAMYWLYFVHIMPIVVMGRQLGKSYGNNTLSWWLSSVRSKDSLINLLTKDRVLRAATIKQIKAIDKHVPFYMSRQTRHDSDNTEEFTVKSLNNQYIGHLPQRSKKAATALGRGLTSKDTFGDEGPFQPNFRLALPAAAAASTAARMAAEEAGTPYGMILTTTAASKDDPDGRYVYDLLTAGAPWAEQYFDIGSTDAVQQVIRKNSAGGKLHVNCTFSHRQLGYTDAQLEKWIEDALVTEDEANRDFRNIWTSGSDGHVLAKNILKDINNSKTDPADINIYNEGYVLKWYVGNPEEYMCNNTVVYGLDPSDAIGSDNIAMVMLNDRSGAVVAVGAFNETNTTVFARWLLQLHLDNPTMVGIIERKSTGVGIIDYLIMGLHKHNINPFTRLYNTVTQRIGELTGLWDKINMYSYSNDDAIDACRKYVGYNTSGTGINSRNMLYVDVFKVAVETCKTTLYDEALVTEILGLTVRNGRIDHGPGTHDDLVVAFLLASYLLYKGNRLEYYNINPTTVLTQTKRESTLPKSEELLQKEYRLRIIELLNKLAGDHHKVILNNYTKELTMLNGKITLEHNESFNMEQAINQVLVLKQKKRPHKSSYM